MSFKIRAKVLMSLGVQSGVSKSGNEWKKATVVVEYPDGQYKSQLALDNMNQAEEFAALKEGDEYDFSFDVKSRQWQDRWFTGCTCFKWEAVAGAQPAAQPAAAPAAQPAAPAKAEDDLPF
jgi:hypothetical protein